MEKSDTRRILMSFRLWQSMYKSQNFVLCKGPFACCVVTGNIALIKLLRFIINLVIHSENGLQTQLIRYDESIDAKAPNQSWTLSVGQVNMTTMLMIRIRSVFGCVCRLRPSSFRFINYCKWGRDRDPAAVQRQSLYKKVTRVSR